MPSHYVAKIGFQVTSTEPADWMYINPCFRRAPALTDMDGLAQDLANALDAWHIWGTAALKIDVKFYDLEGTGTVYPDGVAHKNPAAAPVTYNKPRELAVCLSYYGTHNAPRERGRIYIPYNLMTNEACALRPSAAAQTKAMSLGPIFANLGGADVDWIVWSRKNQTAAKVQNYWVDDEWDVVRSRGLLRTGRMVATTGG